MNKILCFVVVVLLIVAVISFHHETNFSLPKKELVVELKDGNISYQLDDYILCVLAGEMPASFNDEALKAQTVAIRSYTLYQLNNKGYLTKSDQACFSEEKMHEIWGDSYQMYHTKLVNIIQATNNEVMYYHDEIIKAYYFAISNGYTSDSVTVFNEELPYIKAVESNFDTSVKKYAVETSFKLSELKALLKVNNFNNIKVEKDNHNYVTKVTIENSEWDGITFRKLLGLRSASFDLKKNDEVLTITTYGYGHGVGLSQYGANFLASTGYRYQDILNYYYQDITLKSYVY